MSQSKKSSAAESIINVIVGYGVALVSQLVIFPIFDIHVSIQENFVIGAWFTAISLVRSYIIRRWFNSQIKLLALQFGRIK